jgi:hypothetical protein
MTIVFMQTCSARTMQSWLHASMTQAGKKLKVGQLAAPPWPGQYSEGSKITWFVQYRVISATGKSV